MTLRKAAFRVAGALAAVGMLAAAPGAQAHCSSAAETSAFDVAALKSELSVLAVQCGADADYNRFVERARGELIHSDGVVNAWFKRTYGRTAQTRYDSYITLQANEQSLSGQHEGSDFCPRWQPVFTEAMAVPVTLLPEYAAAKNLMPIDLACTSIQAMTAAAAVAARAGRVTVRSAKKK